MRQESGEEFLLIAAANDTLVADIRGVFFHFNLPVLEECRELGYCEYMVIPVKAVVLIQIGKKFLVIAVKCFDVGTVD